MTLTKTTYLLRRTINDQRFRFLVAGGSAALLNWLVRFPLSSIVPYPVAVISALCIGMTYGFIIYRQWAFRSPRTRPISMEIRDFVLVNIAGATITVILTLGIARIAISAGAAIAPAEGIAHGAGIAAGAVVNYVGHKSITFRR
jgi:putative flippase GtrA